MSVYFTRFPSINYNNVTVRDIMRRTNFIKENLSDPLLFLPYTVKAGERPEDISHYYYGSVDYTWLITMANNIIDPYTEWYMDDEQFHSYVMEKYKEKSGKTGYEVISWCLNQSITDNILFYYNEVDDIKIQKETFDTVSEYQTTFRPIRIYEYEEVLNESHKEIRLVDRLYRDKIEKEFRKLISQ